MSDLRIAIGAGQSIMVGPNPGPPPAYANLARIQRLSQPWSAALNRPCVPGDPGAGDWGPAQDPLHGDPQCGVGPMLPYADRRLALLGDPLALYGLVPCAWGGTRIDEPAPALMPQGWMRGYHQDWPYAWLVARTLKAKEAGKVEVLLWAQGPADAALGMTGAAWCQSFHDFVTRYKSDVDLPDLMIVAAALGPTPSTGYPSWADIRAAQLAMNGTHKLLRVVPTHDLGTIDGLHHGAADSAVIGQRMADEVHVMAGGVLPPPIQAPAWRTGDQRASSGGPILAVSGSPGLLWHVPPASALVDGSLADNATNATWFGDGVQVAGQHIDVVFATPKDIHAARLHQSVPAVHGQWKWQFGDGAAFVDACAPFTLGGALEQAVEFTAHAPSTLWRLAGVGGATSGAPYLREIQFKH